MSERNFYPRPISDFITENGEEYVFNIPSYQRGYRWTSKQVEDLLKDLSDFANSEKNHSKVYYLQPLVVRGNGFNWEVLDGQQRLTTLRLLMEELKPMARDIVKSYNIYKINYLQRPNFDFFKAEPHHNMDSYYIWNALNVIKEWKKTKNRKELSDLADILFGFHNTKSINIIWYQAEGEDSSDEGVISIFNRLNRGKIKLTPSELIKALLIISSDKTNNQSSDSDVQTVTSMEWNEMERQFLKNDFFSFINDGNKTYDTRTDLLFNHVARSNNVKESDSDFAYRWFQNKFDEDNGEKKIIDLWNHDIKDAYDNLIQWYSDPVIFNYIGFLSYCNDDIKKINDSITQAKYDKKDKGEKWRKNDTIKQLRNLIKEKFNFMFPDASTDYISALDDLEYSESQNEKANLRKVLLLFNVETYTQRNLRFPFHKFISDNWDIEHVDSQTTNQLSKNEDQKQWLEYCYEILCELATKNSKDLLTDIRNTIDNDYNTSTWNKNFHRLFKEINEAVRNVNPVVNKDGLGNLTLLDAATNRGYGNALFPYKRKTIIDNEKKGKFVPMCTRDLLLKYYTSNDGDTAGINRITWSENDAKAYLEEIKNTLKPFFV